MLLGTPPRFSHSSSSSPTLIQSPLLIHSTIFVVFQQFSLFPHRTNSNLTSHLNFGLYSLAHSFHSMSTPVTISSLWLREDLVKEWVTRRMLHAHFEAWSDDVIPDTEPWLTRSWLRRRFCTFSGVEKDLHLYFWWDERPGRSKHVHVRKTRLFWTKALQGLQMSTYSNNPRVNEMLGVNQMKWTKKQKGVVISSAVHPHHNF